MTRSIPRIQPGLFDEIVVDNFAGGGGASMGIEWGLGRAVDIAINHDPEAVEMHKINHPWTQHYCEDVWDVDPLVICKGRRVGLAWFSPDCKHFSKAKGGKPVSRKIRGLAWIVIKWAQKVRPRVIMLENVEEFQEWGPLVPACEKDGSAKIDMCGQVILVPCGINKGQTFHRWVTRLEKLGYRVDWCELRACDYGAPTIRKRLFLIARCDGLPIVWPVPTHGDIKGGGVSSRKLLPWKTAADCIDWSISCPSIFERKKPLAEATLRRIGKGIMRYVVNNPKPFIVTYCGLDGEDFRCHHAVVEAFLAKNYTGVIGSEINSPVGTVTSIDHHSLVTAILIRNFGKSAGGDIAKPICTVTSKQKDALVTSHLVKLRGTCRDGQPLNRPLPTITASGLHVGEVRAFLLKYYGSDQKPELLKPLHAVTSKDRFCLVTVRGEQYRIVDIGLRMLSPRELFRAQGFPDEYIIDPLFCGKNLSKTAQVRMCGNSVSPHPAAAIVRANVKLSTCTLAP